MLPEKQRAQEFDIAELSQAQIFQQIIISSAIPFSVSYVILAAKKKNQNGDRELQSELTVFFALWRSGTTHSSKDPNCELRQEWKKKKKQQQLQLRQDAKSKGVIDLTWPDPTQAPVRVPCGFSGEERVVIVKVGAFI